MARAQKDLLSRIADVSEGAIQKFADTPGADRLLGMANQLRDRVDDLQRRVRGLEGLEQRLAEVERKVDKLSKSGVAPARRAPSRKPAPHKKPPAA